MASGSTLPGNREKKAMVNDDAEKTGGIGLGLSIVCVLGFAACCETILVLLSFLTDRLLGR
jgi:hypothetical protein